MHTPVLKKEIIEYLNPRPNENFIDCTFGMGGHSEAILERNGPKGKVLGIEADPELYSSFQVGKFKIAGEELAKRMILANTSYTDLRNLVQEYSFGPVNGILFDLGLSSWHLEKSERGFSFQKDEPLDMRYNPEATPLTAYEIVNSFPEKDIEDLLKEYGEEKFARQIARKIVQIREQKSIRTTLDLVEAIWAALPESFKSGKIHPATKTFQALRIKVNSELDNLEKALIQAVDVLGTEGRIVVVSFHSLEDRIVKRFFKRGKQINMLEILTKKPITASEQEIEANPRSRSAKLRSVKKII